jgi:hypothetical protein
MNGEGGYTQLQSTGKKENICVHRFLIESAEKRAAAGRRALAKKRSKKKLPGRSSGKKRNK